MSIGQLLIGLLSYKVGRHQQVLYKALIIDTVKLIIN